jgi:hypothetical protein
MRIQLVFLTIISFLSLSACSTINSRIKEKKADFNSYPPEVQAQIQNGQIDQGFTEDMVYIAKGKPDERSTKVHKGKVIEIWKYTLPSSPQPTSSAWSNDSMSSPYGYPTFGPGPAQPSPVYYNSSYLTIEFKDGKVIRLH